MFCWRGGLRSKIASDWITAAGGEVAKVEGSYKAMRNLSLKIYTYSLRRRPRSILFKGNAQACKSWLSEYQQDKEASYAYNH